MSEGAWREETYAYIRQSACIRDEKTQLKLVVPTEFGIKKGLGAPTLHNLAADPRERRDLADQSSQDTSDLAARLERVREALVQDSRLRDVLLAVDVVLPTKIPLQRRRRHAREDSQGWWGWAWGAKK